MKAFRYLIGPESLWLLAFISIKYFGKYNISMQGRYNDSLESMAYWLLLLMAVVCMNIYLIPVTPKSYLLLRIIIASVIGSHYVFSCCAASHTVGGPGVGMIYVVGLCFTVFFLFIASLVKLFFSQSNDKK
ncbi:hypothetical protein [Emticicia fontis]